jgi:hypothetical protein
MALGGKHVKTREEAVEYLRSRGLHAEKRNWNLGETIVAATGRSEARGISVYSRAMYIVPGKNGWTSFELDRPRSEDETEIPLDQACERVLSILSKAQES